MIKHYKELKSIADKYIRIDGNFPSNAFLILMDIGIPFKNEVGCREDFGGKITPLFKHPAFLGLYQGRKIIYFNSQSEYYNFYILHEISHLLLNHTGSSYKDEKEANLLACILTAPIENLPLSLDSADKLSELCLIPIDRAEEYWKIIRRKQ